MMRIFTVLGIFFYASIIIVAGIVLVAFSFNLLQPQDINNMLNYVQSSVNSRIITGLSGLLLVLISFSFAQLILGRLQREKTIAFSTASGEVTIALSAVEDLIRRLAGVIPEIKELRPDVIANKKGIIVDLRVILNKEVNIPELTSRLQDIARARIQEVLGVEEQIIVKIHVAKIAAAEDKDKRKRDQEKENPVAPFSGYGRI
ncbi:MAG: alkaline shock response membrane anchor protein AmaP [Candidatus Omnitrophica bacterium]|nr:alkaline shock response membrane anchor protein AmaP [Candidatus Omnitrophota bacterium]